MPSTFLKITGFVLLLLCWGCEEPVELEHSEKERLVVACHFSAGEPFKVYVSKTNDPLSSQAPTYLNNASVSIHREEGGTCHLPYTQDFTYPSDFYTDENCVAEAEVYTLHVKAESFEEVWAMDSLPPPVDILSSGISDLEILAQ
ncbi:MAG TPA: DUF4249 family protein, partial [Phaeodactylibacter sp.]|nr:DUF4249 family protein [Phaeodactylibacter sp.]